MLIKLTMAAAVAILALTRPVLGRGPAAKLNTARAPTLIERGATVPAATPAEHHLTFSAKFAQMHGETAQQDDIATSEGTSGAGVRWPPIGGHRDAAHREERGGRATASKLKGRKDTRSRQRLRPRGDEFDGQGCGAAVPGSIGRRSARFVQIRRGPARIAL
ncbi:hypothetical protein PpBr36_02430 [Pyricularia pennisetigena]|uniref:hypothetical protein n=1 Tax=Pyricularia pennisetigena TaxID=1578925 RepID=UPI0011541CD1|nr:hypothetical protein PpBr36_02430 [Pyricularia pennisetigena]TLS31250.1 hypothetical protein PpBr36_02430 [Pyricularia pennisetigena]